MVPNPNGRATRMSKEAPLEVWFRVYGADSIPRAQSARAQLQPGRTTAYDLCEEVVRISSDAVQGCSAPSLRIAHPDNPEDSLPARLDLATLPRLPNTLEIHLPSHETNDRQETLPWVPDQEGTECIKCGQEFSLFRRRHHCRTCGQLVCDSCSQQRLIISGAPTRACDACYAAKTAHSVPSDPATGDEHSAGIVGADENLGLLQAQDGAQDGAHEEGVTAATSQTSSSSSNGSVKKVVKTRQQRKQVRRRISRDKIVRARTQRIHTTNTGADADEGAAAASGEAGAESAPPADAGHDQGDNSGPDSTAAPPSAMDMLLQLKQSVSGAAGLSSNEHDPQADEGDPDDALEVYVEDEHVYAGVDDDLEPNRAGGGGVHAAKPPLHPASRQPLTRVSRRQLRRVQAARAKGGLSMSKSRAESDASFSHQGGMHSPTSSVASSVVSNGSTHHDGTSGLVMSAGSETTADTYVQPRTAPPNEAKLKNKRSVSFGDSNVSTTSGNVSTTSGNDDPGAQDDRPEWIMLSVRSKPGTPASTTSGAAAVTVYGAREEQRTPESKRFYKTMWEMMYGGVDPSDTKSVVSGASVPVYHQHVQNEKLNPTVDATEMGGNVLAVGLRGSGAPLQDADTWVVKVPEVVLSSDETHALYVVKGERHTAEGIKAFTTLRRYSHFVGFKTDLEKELDGVGLPVLPAKWSVASLLNRFDPDHMEVRRSGLQDWLQQVVKQVQHIHSSLDDFVMKPPNEEFVLDPVTRQSVLVHLTAQHQVELVKQVPVDPVRQDQFHKLHMMQESYDTQMDPPLTPETSGPPSDVF